MSSLVLELQQEIIKISSSLPDLLRKALVIAMKLNLKDFENWIRNELFGYKDPESIPQYREVYGSVKGFNNIQNRWNPVIFKGSPEIDELLSKRKIVSTISEIENLVEKTKEDEGDTITVPFTKAIEHKIMESASMDTPPALIIPITQLIKIFDSVKSILLDWSLKLESEGITGEGMTFNSEEINKASQFTYNFYDKVTNSQFNIDSKNSNMTNK